MKSNLRRLSDAALLWDSQGHEDVIKGRSARPQRDAGSSVFRQSEEAVGEPTPNFGRIRTSQVDGSTEIQGPTPRPCIKIAIGPRDPDVQGMHN